MSEKEENSKSPQEKSSQEQVKTIDPEYIAKIIILDKTSEEIKEKLTKIEKKLNSLGEKVKPLDEQSKRPWIKDKRFWAGVAALPSLIVAGWVLDSALPYDGALRSLHSAFGTQKAVSESFVFDQDFRSPILSQLADELHPGSSDFGDAIEDSLGSTFLRVDTFSEILDNELAQRIRVLSVDVTTLGLSDVTKIRLGEQDEATGACRFRNRAANPRQLCVDYTGALESDRSILFSAEPGQKVDISIGLHINELDLPKLQNGEYTFSDVTGSVLLSEVLEVRIDSNDAIISFEDQGQILVSSLQGKKVPVHHFLAKGVTLPQRAGRGDFPLHGISIRLLPGAENLVLSLPVLVARSES